MRGQAGSELEGVQGAQAAHGTMMHQQLPGMIEVSIGNSDDLPKTSGEVGKQTTSHQTEIHNSDEPSTNQACENGMQFDDTESRKEVMRTRVCQNRVDPRCSYLSPIVLYGGASIEEIISHPGLRLLTVFSFSSNSLS